MVINAIISIFDKIKLKIMDLKVMESEALQAINKSEIDISISTAKNYPRNVNNSINEILEICRQSKEIAAECFYALPRGAKTIEGPSIRLAEIMCYSWGNINAGYRIIGNDGKKITAQAIVHDLERNIRISAEVSRRITGKNGNTFTEDMQIVTGNAAGKMALRNAIFSVIPKAITVTLQEKIKEISVGKIKDVKTSAKNAILKFKELDVSESEVLELLGVGLIDKVTVDDLYKLQQILAAINEGTSTVDEVFGRVKSANPKDDKLNADLDKTFDDV